MEKIIPHKFRISKLDRNKLNGHNSFVIWFTGLSGSGKSTIANAVETQLFQQRIHTFSLDGDNIRKGINKDLGFSLEDRSENIRRIAEVAKLFVDSGVIVLASFISPLQRDRQLAKKIIGEDNIIEVFINTSLEECERRDVKGLYRKARAGEIKDFTGIGSPYETPEDPDLEIKTENETIGNSVQNIISFISEKYSLKNE